MPNKGSQEMSSKKNEPKQKKVNKKKKAGRSRRGKKDVILDFTKRAKGTKPQEPPQTTESSSTKSRKSSNKLSLATSSRDYDQNLGLPDRVEQREFETTGQFFRRLDRLVAKAKVEANLDTRFDTSISMKKGKPMKIPDEDVDD